MNINFFPGPPSKIKCTIHKTTGYLGFSSAAIQQLNITTTKFIKLGTIPGLSKFTKNFNYF